jgi:hypothetical protein
MMRNLASEKYISAECDCSSCTDTLIEGVQKHFEQDTFLRRGVISTSPNTQAGGPPLVGCPRLLIKYIPSYPPYWVIGIGGGHL